jgi:hypothetical protein
MRPEIYASFTVTAVLLLVPIVAPPHWFGWQAVGLVYMVAIGLAGTATVLLAWSDVQRWWQRRQARAEQATVQVEDVREAA